MRRAGKALLTCWLGEESVGRARRICHDAGIADYRTPEEAVRAFMQLVTYRRNQELLRQTPPAQTEDLQPDRETAEAIVARVLREERSLLTEPEAKSVLRAYGIPVVETRIADMPWVAWVIDAVIIGGVLLSGWLRHRKMKRPGIVLPESEDAASPGLQSRVGSTVPKREQTPAAREHQD